VTGSATFLHLRITAGATGPEGGLPGEVPRELSTELSGGVPGGVPAELAAELSGGAREVPGAQEGTHLVAELAGTRQFTPGEPATAYVDPSDVFVFDRSTGRVLAEDATEVEMGVDGG